MIPTKDERYIQRNTSAVNITPERTGYTFLGWYTTAENQIEDFKVDFANQISKDTEFYAKWQSNFKVTFNYNYPDCPEPYVEEVAKNGKVAGIIVTWNENNALEGWYTEATGGTKVTFPVIVEEDINYYAHWSQEVIKVTYNLNYDDKVEYKYTAKNTTAENYSPIREGYEFGGWYTEKDKVNQTEENKVQFNYLTEDPDPYYAKWLKKCKVTFNYNIGSAPETHDVYVKEGETVTSYPATMTNSALEGWYTKATDGTKVTFPATISDDIVYYANWTSSVVKVTYNYNMGTNPTEEQSYIIKGTSAQNKEVEMSGYIFDGWYLEKELNNKATFGTLEEDITYYAKWLKNCKVTFSFNYTGSTTVYETYVKEGEKVQSYPAARSGYALDGWFKDTGTTEGNEVNFDEVINEDKIYYAKWTENLVKVTFNYNYGDNPITEESYIVKNTTAENLTAEREGYVFAGWYTVSEENKQNEDTKADFSLQLTTNKTYFAKWLKKCKVSFDYNYSGSPVPYVAYVIQGEHATSFPASRTNYGLVGWYSVSDAEQQKNATPVDFSSTVITKDVTYYAGWLSDYAVVKYHYNDTADKVETRQIAAGTTIELFTPQREGDWHFDGWYTDAETQNAATSTTAGNGQTYDYYAKWTKIHTVTFDYNYDNCPAAYKEKIVSGESVSGFQAFQPGYILKGLYKMVGDTKTDETFPAIITCDITYYADWESADVKVTFDYNYDSKKSETYIKSGSSVAENTPSRTGYNFIGWYTTATPGNSDSAVSFPVNNVSTNKTYYAKWGALKYDITFDLNQGKEESSYYWNMSKPVKHEFGKSTTLPTPSIYGYMFKGWYTDVGCKTSEVEVLGATDYTKNIVLYAKWEAKQYTVTFVNEKEGATDPSMKTKVVTYGSAYGTLATTKLENWEFEWYDAQTDGNLIDASTIVSIADDHTLYARGIETLIEVTYDYNHDSLKKVSKFARNTTPFEETPSRTGYIFDGWYTEKETQDATTKVDFTKPLTTKVTFVAKWTVQTYNITYDLHDGTAPTGEKENPATYTYGTGVSAFNNPTRTGYKFDGWYDISTGGSKITEISETATGDVTLHAQWTADTYTVTFVKNDSNASALSIENKTVTFGQPYGSLATTSKVNWSYEWYDAENGGNKIDENTLVSKTSDHTLYAHWTQNIFKVIYNFGYESKTTFRSNVYGTTPSYVAAIRTGYVFDGWYYTDTNGASTGVPVDYESPVTSDMTLIAKWSPAKYSITYMDEGGIGFSATSWDTGAGSIKFTYEYDGTNNIPIIKPLKTGYNFAGWFTESGELTHTGTGSDKSYYIAAGTTGNMTLYAKWTIQNYEIKYKNPDGTDYTGTFIKTQPTQHTYGSETILVNANNSDKAAFVGWYLDKECTEINKVTKLGKTDFTGTITLYAKWAPYYKIIYKTLSKVDSTYTVVEETNASGCPKIHTYGIQTDLSVLSKEGYLFGGWYADVNLSTGEFVGSSISSLGGISYNNDITLYAKWIPIKYSIKFDKGSADGSQIMTDINNVEYDQEIDLTSCSFTKTGHDFAGWETKDGKQLKPNDSSIIIGKNLSATDNDFVTLSAVWTPHVYTISYSINGGTAATGSPIKHTYGTPTTVCNPSENSEYYHFGYWTGSNGKDYKPASGSITIGGTDVTSDITLTAKWELFFYYASVFTCTIDLGTDGSSRTWNNICSSFNGPSKAENNIVYKSGSIYVCNIKNGNYSYSELYKVKNNEDNHIYRDTGMGMYNIKRIYKENEVNKKEDQYVSSYVLDYATYEIDSEK